MVGLIGTATKDGTFPHFNHGFVCHGPVVESFDSDDQFRAVAPRSEVAKKQSHQRAGLYHQVWNTLFELHADRSFKDDQTPGNMALTGEVGELSEVFQWMSEADSQHAATNPETAQAVEDEIADVLLYLVRLADVLKVDLNEAVTRKLKTNALKYPIANSLCVLQRARLYFVGAVKLYSICPTPLHIVYASVLIFASGSSMAHCFSSSLLCPCL